MNPREYEVNVLKTESCDFEKIKARFQDERMIRIMHAALGLSSELSEIKEAMCAADREFVIDYVNLREETGDLAWYTAVVIHAMGLKPSLVWPTWGSNANKLFSPTDVVNATVDKLVIAVGELNNYIKRALFYGKPFDFTAVENTVMDICNGIGSLAFCCGINLSQAMAMNIAKLRERYGEKFTEEAAINRDLASERKVLES